MTFNVTVEEHGAGRSGSSSRGLGRNLGEVLGCVHFAIDRTKGYCSQGKEEGQGPRRLRADAPSLGTPRKRSHGRHKTGWALESAGREHGERTTGALIRRATTTRRSEMKQSCQGSKGTGDDRGATSRPRKGAKLRRHGRTLEDRGQAREAEAAEPPQPMRAKDAATVSCAPPSRGRAERQATVHHRPSNRQRGNTGSCERPRGAGPSRAPPSDIDDEIEFAAAAAMKGRLEHPSPGDGHTAVKRRRSGSRE